MAKISRLLSKITSTARRRTSSTLRKGKPGNEEQRTNTTKQHEATNSPTKKDKYQVS